MRFSKFVPLCAFLALWLVSCATASVMKTTEETYPPTNPSDVKIFLSEKPTQPYKEIGRVRVDKYTNMAISKSGETIQKEIKEQAASIGGQAIINVTEDFASTAGVVIVFTQQKK